MANKKFKLKTGDTVKVIAGNEKGKSAKVVKVLVDSDRIVLEGLNLVTKHKKPSAANPNGGIEKVEAAMHVSNVMLVDSSNGQPTRVGRKLDENGKLQRFSKKTGNIL